MEQIEKIVGDQIISILKLPHCATWEQILEEIKRLKELDTTSCTQWTGSSTITYSPGCIEFKKY